MKIKLLFALLLVSPFIMAQNNPKATPPVIVAVVSLGNTVTFDDTTITFSKVIEDSRCPSDVTCVWAGQAKVLTIITTINQIIERELVFHGTAHGAENENTLFTSNSKKYVGFGLSPYPESSVHISEREYQLEIYIK